MIRKKLLGGAAIVALALMGTAGASTAAPSPDQASPNIVGGDTIPISSAPYAVQIHVNSTGNAFNCSGSLISSQWVLTARHCEGTKSVRLGSSSLNQGTLRTVAADYAWSGGDVRLLKLSTPYYGTTVTLNKDRVSVNQAADAYGWGRTCGACSASSLLKHASVKITGGSYDAYNGPAVETYGVDGQVYKGDSGGPLMVGGQQSGVLSTGGGNPDSIYRYANYAYVYHAMPWITSVSGVTGQ
ncbi:S1 family peptidase [Arthrobacter roseus]|uniref:S1 family peptidase n=1 Tax=Arthrobacter roseus TaxID=136274 RepID=UPI001962B074|nr:trypsin-like serine protease [Arthrobacter roseus]MBM7847929.1 secreted trypsin-like serine protease [Arthrobacter roseus]